MKNIATLLGQIAVIVTSICACAFMLIEPLYEGRNVNATLFEVYFKDPFLAYVYVSSIFFFVGAYKVYKIMRYIREDKTFSTEMVQALRSIQRCALALVVLIFVPLMYLVIVRPEDDIAGGVAIGLFLLFMSALVAGAARRFERHLGKDM